MIQTNFLSVYFGRITQNLRKTFLGFRDTGLAILGIGAPKEKSFLGKARELRPGSPEKENFDPTLASYFSQQKREEKREEGSFNELLKEIQAERPLV